MFFTDRLSANENDTTIQHDCLYMTTLIDQHSDSRQFISYCMSDSPSEWKIQSDHHGRKFTFMELYKLNVTSQELYAWSAPIDVAERYQFYLNQISISKEASKATQHFYNCTSPRFGPECQYAFNNYKPHHSSLNDIIRDFYMYGYEPTRFTCYDHVQCDRGAALACLDWSEICDGKVDCLDAGLDEENCWQLELNECEDGQYRCVNGQCIPSSFFRDDTAIPDCLDGTDEYVQRKDTRNNCTLAEPVFQCEEVTCTSGHRYWKPPLTGSCVEKRNDLLMEAMFLHKPGPSLDECWSAFLCILHVPYPWDPACLDLCEDRQCDETIRKYCPDMMYIPNVPLLFGHVYFLYAKNESKYRPLSPQKPQYVCYNEQLCHGLLINKPFFMFNSSLCRRFEDFTLQIVPGRGSWMTLYVIPLYKLFWTCNSIINNESSFCNRSTIYQCFNSSKCISRHRINDRLKDCPYFDDEYVPLDYETCPFEGLGKYFRCKTTNECISHILVGDGSCHCSPSEINLCDDEFPMVHFARENISFATICDGFVELLAVTIDGRRETDETECEQWLCNNTYTRCDGHWNCFDGADEVDCDPWLLENCPYHHHMCVSTKTSQLTCLPLEKANDDHIDCLGATDEPKLCRSDNHVSKSENFYCNQDENRDCIVASHLCDSSEFCEHGDDEEICDINRNFTFQGSICHEMHASIRSDVEKFLCKRPKDMEKKQIVYFALDQIRNSIEYVKESKKRTNLPSPYATHQYHGDCNRGLALDVLLDYEKNLITTACLCPPSFYGYMCQYQNQRVSLTMQLQTFSDAWRTVFVVSIALVDSSDERYIHSHEQFSYLPMRDCKMKFNIYLFYATRPKDHFKNYTVQVDIYEKISLVYRGSWLLPLNFTFLPVHRLAVQIKIPRNRESIEICSDYHCIHGQCIKYVKNPNKISFCQCHRGWTGRHCSIPYTGTCSPSSTCIGVSTNNRSVCICPIESFGPRCLLKSMACYSNQNALCHNHGQCIPVDEHVLSNKKFTCICRHGFSGDNCEINDFKIILSFGKDMTLPESMLLHFIRAVDHNPHERGTIFKSIPTNINSVTVYWSHPFHLIFVEFFSKQYYLVGIQRTHNRSMIITAMVDLLNRCAHIKEVLNETIVKLPMLRRIKYYHVPCQKRPIALSCFYDEKHLCFCDDYGQQRLVNCFDFDHDIRHDCFSQSSCENGARCFQDNQNCAQTSICVCPVCFYGRRCQFSTNGFGLSFDGILGYHIQVKISLAKQPLAVQISMALTLVMTTVGFVDGILSVITFKNKKLRDVGCGIYLLAASITSLLTIFTFALKFWILLFAQMALILNRSFLYLQCISIDYLLQIFLGMNQWLTACVATERAIIVIKGINFDKKKSSRMAKYIIFILLMLLVSTAIHDPIHRRLIDDNEGEENRIWCIVSYSSSLRAYNYIVHSFNFFVPFLINCTSAVLIVTKYARQRVATVSRQTYRQHLIELCRQNYHILVGPLMVIIIACPRIVITFASGCVKSTRGSWLLLAGYFISFIPSMLTFFLFVLPSELYMGEFSNSISRYRKIMQTYLRRNP